jgi:hypothetical protein
MMVIPIIAESGFENDLKPTNAKAVKKASDTAAFKVITFFPCD